MLINNNNTTRIDISTFSFNTGHSTAKTLSLYTPTLGVLLGSPYVRKIKCALNAAHKLAIPHNTCNTHKYNNIVPNDWHSAKGQ